MGTGELRTSSIGSVSAALAHGPLSLRPVLPLERSVAWRLQGFPIRPDARQTEPAAAAILRNRVAAALGRWREPLACLRDPGLVSYHEIECLSRWTSARFWGGAAPLVRSALESSLALEIAALALAVDPARLRAARPLLRERIEETQRRRIHPDAPDLATVSRSEPYRHRRLRRTLHERETLQHRRRGRPTPACADASRNRWREGDYAK